MTTTATILLVDDEDDVRELTRAMLRRAGYEVLAAASRAEALRVFAAGGAHVDVLVADVCMEEGSGPDLHRMLASVQPHLPVIFISGYTGDTVHREAWPVDARFLEKPFSMKALTDGVRELLGDMCHQAAHVPSARTRAAHLPPNAPELR